MMLKRCKQNYSQAGQTLSEFALILGMVTLVGWGGAQLLGGTVSSELSHYQNSFTNNTPVSMASVSPYPPQNGQASSSTSPSSNPASTSASPNTTTAVPNISTTTTVPQSISNTSVGTVNVSPSPGNPSSTSD